MRKTVVIDCFMDAVPPAVNGCAIVAVDVIRTCTTAVTGVLGGRRCFPVPSLEMAVPLAAGLDRPLLVGELGGNMPYGFELNNSPAQLARREDTARPMILLTTSGTKLICAPATHDVYVTCLRNYEAQAGHLLKSAPRVALVGAGTRGEFREEDPLCCAWIAEILTENGYEPLDATRDIVE